MFTITTAAEASQRHDSILGRLLDAAHDADDVEREPGLTVCRLPEAGTLVYEFAAPTTDPRDVKAMKLANPATWITESFLRRQAEDPELTDAQVLQLHGCVWAATDTTWIAPEAWATRVDRDRRLQDGEKLVLGFDGSFNRDSTALIASTLDGFVSPIAVWERPDRAAAEWKVPRQEVHDTFADAMETYDVVELAADVPGWVAEVDSWREAYGDVVVEFATNRRERMAAACDRFRTGVLEGDLSRDGSPVLAAHVGHCLAKATPYGVTISKDSSDSPRKIDAAVAAVIAYERGEVERDERGRGLGGVGMIALTSCACCQTRRNPEVGTGRAFLAHLSQMTRITMQVSAYFCDTSRPIRDPNETL